MYKAESSLGNTLDLILEHLGTVDHHSDFNNWSYPLNFIFVDSGSGGYKACPEGYN